MICLELFGSVRADSCLGSVSSFSENLILIVVVKVVGLSTSSNPALNAAKETKRNMILRTMMIIEEMFSISNFFSQI